MTAINPGDTVHVRQVDGDFQSRSAVRHVHIGTDRFRKLGLEFLDRAAPDHLVPSDGSQPRTPLGLPKAPPEASVPEAPPPPAPVPEPAPAQAEERRKDSRLMISIDVMLRRLSAGGSVLQEERTVADNLGRHGARVLSAITGLVVGEIVSIQEVGTDFQTRAEIRSLQLGADKIQRLGLRFLDRATPVRLLPDGDSKPRLSPLPLEPPPPPSQPLPAAPVAPENAALLIDEILREGRSLLAEGKFWDAIQTLEGGLNLAPGTRTNQTLRVVLAEVTAKNPKWRARAEEMLVALTRETPVCVEAFIALSAFYQEDGQKARAATQLRKVLEFQPGHADVLARLKALD